ncbi:MAG: hypothetical protein HZB51_09865 [Chloroflexi bacterium]|nr:hypothetical protein [Chloroflexota bacterium]
MTNSPPSNQAPSSSGGIDVSGGAVNAGRDVVGRDVVNVSSGFSSRAVIALVAVVGFIVFFATACSLATGIVIGGAAVTAFNRPVESTQAAAESMTTKLRALNSLRSGQAFRLSFTETEISSFTRFVAGPSLGLNDARVRLLDQPGQFALRGEWTEMGHLPVIATFQLTSGDQPLRLENAAVQVLPLGDSFGWVLVTPFAQPLADRVNNLFQNARFNQVQLQTNPRGWIVTGTIK